LTILLKIFLCNKFQRLEKCHFSFSNDWNFSAQEMFQHGEGTFGGGGGGDVARFFTDDILHLGEGVAGAADVVGGVAFEHVEVVELVAHGEDVACRKAAVGGVGGQRVPLPEVDVQDGDPAAVAGQHPVGDAVEQGLEFGGKLLRKPVHILQHIGSERGAHIGEAGLVARLQRVSHGLETGLHVLMQLFEVAEGVAIPGLQREKVGPVPQVNQALRADQGVGLVPEAALPAGFDHAELVIAIASAVAAPADATGLQRVEKGDDIGMKVAGSVVVNHDRAVEIEADQAHVGWRIFP
jgi:hypothetical protein